MDFNNYCMAALAIIVLLLGIASIVGFIATGMGHCLVLAGMAFGMVGIWYHEKYYSKD